MFSARDLLGQVTQAGLTDERIQQSLDVPAPA